MRHATLWKVARKLGSAKALAAELKISYANAIDWINLKNVPPFCKGVVEKNDTAAVARAASLAKHWPIDRQTKLEKALFELTGQTLLELFPPELCANAEFLNAKKQIEQTREISTARLSGIDQRFILPPADEIAAQNEILPKIKKALKTLSYRERVIIEMRYGLGDGHTYTLEEVGNIFKVHKNRIYQIEAKAIRKLQTPSRSQQLAGLLDNQTEPEHDASSFVVRRRQIMRQTEPIRKSLHPTET